MYGPVQQQHSLAGPTFITADHPLCFQINNPAYGTNGPRLLKSDYLGANSLHQHGSFALSQGNPLHELDEDMHPNGPKLLLKSVDLQFKFEGFVDNTHIRVDIVRQKKAVDPDVWNPNGTENFMPSLLYGFKNLAGFTANTLDRRTFEVLATRKLFMNSRGSSNAIDTAQDRLTVDATTRNVKFCNINLNLNKVVKQLRAAHDEHTGDIMPGQDTHGEDGNLAKGQYGYDNIHPLANIWCIVSSDDATHIGSVVDGDGVKCHIIRKCVWRDHLGNETQ